MTKRSTLGGGTLLALALLFIGLTVLFNYALRGWRLDLTQNHLYTTAPGTDRILTSIKEPINLYFFLLREDRRAAPAAEDLRHAGARVPGGAARRAPTASCTCTSIDPQPFSEEEDRATELGVRSAPVGRGRQPVLLRSRRHQLHRRPRGHRVLRSEQGAVPRVRRRQAHLPARESEEARGRVAVDPADGRRLRPAGRASMREPWVVYSAGAAAVRRAAAASRPRPRSTRTSTCWSSCIRRGSRRRPSSPSTSTRCAAVTSWCSSIRSPRPTLPAADPQQPDGGDGGRQVLAFRHRC